MNGLIPVRMIPPSSSTISITVLSVPPAQANKLFAFASIEIDRYGLQIVLPKFRGADGVWRTAMTLSQETYTPIARAVLSVHESNNWDL